MAQVTDRTVGANPTGFDMRTELNNIIGALESDNSGSSEPLNTVAGMKWMDTSNATYYYVKERNHDNTAWVTLFRYTVSTKVMEVVSNGVVLQDSALVHKTGNETIAGVKTFSSTILGSISGNAGTASSALSLALQAGSIDSVTETKVIREEEPSGGYAYTSTLNMTSGDGRQQITVERGGLGMKFRGNETGAGSTGWSAWRDVIHNANLQSYLDIQTINAATVTNGVYTTGSQTIGGVKTFTSSPIVPTPTAGTQAVNKDYADLKVALASFIGTNQSLVSHGYQKLPGGLIIQWGVNSVLSGTQETVVFPLTFPNNILQVVASRKVDGAPATAIAVHAFPLSASQIKLGFWVIGGGSQDIAWIAIGY